MVIYETYQKLITKDAMSCKKIPLIKTKTNASAMVMRRCVLIT